MEDLGELPGAGERLEIWSRIWNRITRELGGLEVDFDDWQILYRQVLQVGRSIHGQPQLMDAEMSRR